MKIGLKMSEIGWDEEAKGQTGEVNCLNRPREVESGAGLLSRAFSAKIDGNVAIGCGTACHQ